MAQELSGRAAWLIQTGALATSIPVYVLVAFFAVGRREAPPEGPPGLLPWLLAGACLALLAVSATVAPRVAPGARRAELPPAGWFRSRSLLSVALVEAAAIVGLVGAFLMKDVRAALFPAGAALLLLGVHHLPNGLRYWAALERPDDEIPALGPE